MSLGLNNFGLQAKLLQILNIFSVCKRFYILNFTPSFTVLGDSSKVNFIVFISKTIAFA